MNTKRQALAVFAAIVGGILGVIGFLWIAKQGLYGIILPGALTGICAGTVKSKSAWVAFVSGFLSLGFGLYAEWKFAPFASNESLGFFLAHIHQLRPVTLIMLAAGVWIGFGVPYRDRHGAN